MPSIFSPGLNPMWKMSFGSFAVFFSQPRSFCLLFLNLRHSCFKSLLALLFFRLKFLDQFINSQILIEIVLILFGITFRAARKGRRERFSDSFSD